MYYSFEDTAVGLNEVRHTVVSQQTAEFCYRQVLISFHLSFNKITDKTLLHNE